MVAVQVLLSFVHRCSVTFRSLTVVLFVLVYDDDDDVCIFIYIYYLYIEYYECIVPSSDTRKFVQCAVCCRMKKTHHIFVFKKYSPRIYSVFVFRPTSLWYN